MLGRFVLFAVIAVLVLPLLVNVYFYFVEKELAENPVSQNSVSEVTFTDGKTAYASRCASCHGLNGDGAGGYPRVNGESRMAIMARLIGYKNGSYGSTAKGVMMLQVQDLGTEQLDAIARYLSGLTPVLNEEELKKFDTIELDHFDISS
jgi:cytochrome c553